MKGKHRGSDRGMTGKHGGNDKDKKKQQREEGMTR